MRFKPYFIFIIGACFLILNACQNESKPEILHIDLNRVTSIQYGEPNNSSELIVFKKDTIEGEAVIHKIIDWYNEASYKGKAPDSQLGIRTMGYPSLRIFVENNDSSIFVNVVNKNLNVIDPSLEEPLAISSSELVEWMETGWEKDK